MQGVKGTTDVAARREWNRNWKRRVGSDGLNNQQRYYRKVGSSYYNRRRNIVGEDGRTGHQRRYRNNKEERLATTRKCVQEKKDKLYNLLGGYTCRCCGETEPMFLTIDHVNGGGANHRKSLSSNSIYFGNLLKDPEVASKYQVLCSNCNSGRYRNGGICPHRRGD